MGYKRTFEAEDVQELNFKHARQTTYSNDLTNQDGEVPCHVSLEKTDVPFSWNPTGLCEEEDEQSGGTNESSLSHESPETDSPTEDVNWCLDSPRKLVPIGRNHQADIPECIKDQVRAHSEERLLGKCVIPMPTDDPKVGKGREECVCLDKGSIRCVQQHIMENREALFDTIGYERCKELGLCEMGEEVSDKFTEEEEDRFHEIVYQNPASVGRDFWKQLKYSFPLRTMKEIVSYYFNVFILRRRSVQNRCKGLEIDSDDDEWQAEYDDDVNSAGGDEKTVRAEEDDSCMSFDFQSNREEETNIGNYGFMDNSYPFDSNDSILPDNFWSKDVEFLPTSNILDEIFGQDPWDDFTPKESK